MIKFGFYLMSEKGLTVLRNHIRRYGKETISFVVASRDENVEKDFYEEIGILCKKNGVKFYDRKTKASLKADHSFAVSWKWMIQAKNLVVFHDSLLPRYRGFAPLVNMLIKGEEKIGVTALVAGKEYDSGNIIAQKAI